MQSERSHPEITGVSWGRVEVEEGGVFKDAKLYPGGAEEWDWNETGTRHSPGVQPADVRPLLDRGASAVVIGTGFHERLEVRPETLRMLEERGESRPTCWGPRRRCGCSASWREREP